MKNQAKSTIQMLHIRQATSLKSPALNQVTVAIWTLLLCLVSAQAATVTLQHGVTPRIGGGTYTGTTDSWLDETSGSQDDNYGASHELRVRYDGSLNGAGFAEDHTVIKFDLPVLSFSTVGTASLELFYFEARDFLSDNVLGIKPYRIATNRWWYENDGGPEGKDNQGVNYLYRDQYQTLPWTSLGAWNDKIDDGNGTNLIKRTGGSVPGPIEPGNWVPFNVQPSVAQWYAGATNNGFSVFSCWFQGGGNMVWARFASRDTNNTALRPKLTINYQGAGISWDGSINNSWDTNTANWNVGGYRGTYGNGDFVTFADGASSPTITIAGAGVSPSSVTITNNATIYSFSGGSIGGGSGVTKRGAGQATLGAANAYTGLTLVQAGRLIVSANNALGATASGTVVSNGAALGLQSVTYAAAEPLTISGAGIGGSGALYAVSGNNTFGGPVTLAADSTLGVGSGLGLTLNGAIGGGFSLTKSGAGTLTFSGAAPNTYSGATWVNDGLLALAKTAGPAVPGALFIGDGVNAATVRLDNHGQLSPASGVTVYTGSLLNLNNFSSSIGSLMLSNASVVTGTGTLTLGGAVTSTGNGMNLISGNLDMGGVTRAFNVSDGAAEDDLRISANIGNVIGMQPAGITKLGAGRLLLTGNNTYDGETVVATGVLTVTTSAGLGQTAGGTVVSNGARLELRGHVTVGAEPLRLNGHGGGRGALAGLGGDSAWSGPIWLDSTTTIGADVLSSLTLNGAINGSGHGLSFNAAGNMAANGVIQGGGMSVTKNGAGILTFGGVEPNLYTGLTRVNQGTLILAKQNGPAVPGALEIGDPVLLNPATVICKANDQFNPGINVTVRQGSVLDVNGFQAMLAGLTLMGGTVETRAGSLRISGPLTSRGGDASWVLGNLALSPFCQIRAEGPGVLYIGAQVTGGSFVKWREGLLVFTNANTFTDECTIAGGPVSVSNDPAKGYGLGPGAVIVETAPILGEFDALLGGSGSVCGPVTVRNNGILSPGPLAMVGPGPIVGALVVSNQVILGPQGVLLIEVDRTGRDIDVLDLQGGGNLEIANSARLRLVGNLTSERPLVFVKRAQAVQGTFDGLPQGAEVPGQPGWFIHYGRQRIYFSQVQDPSPVYFRAFATNGVVVVSWRTALELETTGFDLFRWEEGVGWVKVNQEPIPPQNPDGAVYMLVDPGIQPDFSYRYRLTEYASGGVENYEYERTPTEFAFSAPPGLVPEGVELRWWSRTDETYELQWTDDISQPVIPVLTNVLATPPQCVVTHQTTNAHGFYRVRMVP